MRHFDRNYFWQIEPFSVQGENLFVAESAWRFLMQPRKGDGRLVIL